MDFIAISLGKTSLVLLTGATLAACPAFTLVASYTAGVLTILQVARVGWF